MTKHYLNQWWLHYWCIYASLGLNELTSNGCCCLFLYNQCQTNTGSLLTTNMPSYQYRVSMIKIRWSYDLIFIMRIPMPGKAVVEMVPRLSPITMEHFICWQYTLYRHYCCPHFHGFHVVHSQSIHWALMNDMYLFILLQIENAKPELKSDKDRRYLHLIKPWSVII